MTTKNQEEIEFLKGYIHYSPFARVLEVEALWEKAKDMKPCDERGQLFFLAVESFFMQQETLYKFIKAVKEAARGKNFLRVIEGTTFNPSQDIPKALSVNDLKIEYPVGISENDKEKINDRFNSLIKTCRNLAKPNSVFLNLYYCLKHGFLIYKLDGEIFGLMHEQKEEEFTGYLEKLGVKGKKHSLYKNDFSYLIDLNKRIAHAIQDVIALRLLQLGVTKF